MAVPIAILDAGDEPHRIDLARRYLAAGAPTVWRETPFVSPGELMLVDFPVFVDETGVEHGIVYPPHIHELDAEIVDACLDIAQRFVLNVEPVRHGKSLLASVYTSAWYLLRYPTRDVMVICATEDKALEFGEEIRSIVRRWSWLYGVKVSKSTASKKTFRLTVGDRDRGRFRAVGRGGQITGGGADLLIVDDLIKDRAEASDPEMRQKTWRIYRSTIRTRLKPTGTVLVTNSRWHADDIGGRIIKETNDADTQYADRYRVLHRPAIATVPRDVDPTVCPYTARTGSCQVEATVALYREDWKCPAVWHSEDGRVAGEALWPSMYPIPVLEALRSALGDQEFAAQLQGSPTVEGGNHFKVEQLARTGKVPAGIHWAWGIDRALSTSGDWTVCLLVGMVPSGRILIARVVRFRTADPAERDRKIRDAVRSGPKSAAAVIETPAGEGKASATKFRAGLGPRPVHFETPTKSKMARAEAVIGCVNQGASAFILYRDDVEPGWRQALVDELELFPSGTHDDQVDALAHAYNYLMAFRNISAAAP